MKTLFLGLWATVLAVGLAGQAVAVPLTYTFEGTIDTIQENTAGLLSGAGSYIYYVMEVDFEQPGQLTTRGGELLVREDDLTRDYFFTDYIEGTALEMTDGFFNTLDAPNIPAEYNYGYDSLNYTNGALLSNSFNDYFEIYHPSLMPSEWTVGTAVQVEDRAYGPLVDGQGILLSEFVGSLTLTDIQGEPGASDPPETPPSDPPPDPSPQPSPPPAPEPGTLWLLGLGIAAGLGFCKRRDDHAA